MNNSISNTRTRAQESSGAIERLYITMRHLFSRGYYKPMGSSGETLIEALLMLQPEIYGSISEKKMELNGLLYITERLPIGIELCQFINLTADEGDLKLSFESIVPQKRRRNCYRIDEDLMHIEITRGKSDIYDVITHLTFLCIESHKLMRRVLNKDDEGTDYNREWLYLETVVNNLKGLSHKKRDVAFVHLGRLLGRTFEEVKKAHQDFALPNQPDRFFTFVYDLGNTAIAEETEGKERMITFSELLREQLGHHVYGEIWARNVHKKLFEKGYIKRPIHIISANMHSVLNTLYAKKALGASVASLDAIALYEKLSDGVNDSLREKVKRYSQKHGLTYIKDHSGANINVQLIDTAALEFQDSPKFKGLPTEEKPVIVVMDYAFGEQAYETMEELLKPYYTEGASYFLNVASVSIMGKAGILEGGKGDIMIPSAHVFEGTADNYPFTNQLSATDFKEEGLQVSEGSMITVLGTSLQNKEVLKFFYESTWNVIGLEMEGAHYQKAIQAAAKIRGNISEDVQVRYAYYASDNPLETGSTLASGGLGTTGVRPTYVITQKIIDQIVKS
jgi:hypothetical protein